MKEARNLVVELYFNQRAGNIACGGFVEYIVELDVLEVQMQPYLRGKPSFPGIKPDVPWTRKQLGHAA